ncbi:MAG: helix-turn-helix transcriptional regulator [Clostridia bacterium]|nr:helix-turn-helix transcriptional regulator [Clostridia bacterium]
MRIQKAKFLLANGVLTITAISEECGFSSLYHFCRIFKEKTGFTPSEYSKNNRIYKI